MEYVLIVFYSVLFSVVILKWKWYSDTEVNRYVYIGLFILKIAAAIFAGELYLRMYNGGDTYSFFNDSRIISDSYFTNKRAFLGVISGLGDDQAFMKQFGSMAGWNNYDVVYNDSRTIIRLHAIIGLISLGYYNVHAVFFAFLSFLGLTGIYKVARLLTGQHPYLLLAAVFLTPGVIFWCSLASKESLLVFALGMFLYHTIRLLTVSKSAGNMIGMFISGFLFIHIKAYLLVLITPCLLAFTWVHVSHQRYSLLKYTFVYIAFIVLFFNLKNLLRGFDPVDILVMKRMNFEAYADLVPKDFRSYIELPEFTSSWGDILTASPIAAFSVFTRPYIWESSGLLFTAAAIENLLLAIILLAGFRYIQWDKMAQNKTCCYFAYSS